MSTATTISRNGSTELATVEAAPTLSPQTLERLVIHGDLSKLSPEQKVEYYVARCRAAGLDPATKPFEYLVLKGKHVLYATKACTDQLAGLHKLTVEITDRYLDKDAGIFNVQCRVRFPDGRHVEDFAALPVHRLGGDDLCNALMKAVTKAKRRTILSALGLGMFDETEVETIAGATTRPVAEVHDPDTGEARLVDPNDLPRSELPDGGSPRTDRAYREWQSGFLAGLNERWRDYWSTRLDGDTRGVPEAFLDAHRLSGHLVKHLDGPRTQNANHRVRFLGIALRDDPEGLKAEAGAYARKVFSEQRDKLLADLSIPAEPDDDDQADPDRPDEPDPIEEAEIDRQAARDAD